ncbi:uncharacterized protein LOC9663272 isoform X2 [Selaginella moellendorffii]|uniref:uncharacterized protein LOC9663272 isoform X2 n=1 Tax=Selaginella moellendorffii TaxID=88036 RepID=UPI000D1CD3E3|nr:uncharacterized protein LOC9663272 isoform X2 [Selaginella moellendorffii]|eukprot:XP_024540281.1 uncharacterized protein LOC9663272 isoform X2 [Selaginella moellendorffii]
MEIEEAVIAAAKKLGWRLKARHCHCLARDLFFVLVGVRPLVMIDYLPYSANLLQLLTSLVNSVCEAFKGWRLMSMDESMIYFLHAANLEEYMESSLGDESWLSFIILDDGPARMATQLEEQSVKATLKRLQARLSQSLAEESRECSLIDFNHGLSELDISIPTCNGWLLGYPVIYVFSKDKASQASRCLSSVHLCLYKLLLLNPEKVLAWRPHEPVEEILSFTIPESNGFSQQWTPDAFMSYIATKVSQCSKIDPGDLRLDVTSRPLQSVAF